MFSRASLCDVITEVNLCLLMIFLRLQKAIQFVSPDRITLIHKATVCATTLSSLLQAQLKISTVSGEIVISVIFCKYYCFLEDFVTIVAFKISLLKYHISS